MWKVIFNLQEKKNLDTICNEDMTNIIFSGHLWAFPLAVQKPNFFSFSQKLLKLQNVSALLKIFQLLLCLTA